MKRRRIWPSVAMAVVAVAIVVMGSAAQQPAGEKSDPHAGHGQHGQHKVAEGVELAIRDNPGAQTITLRLGPFNLPANTDHMAMPQAPDGIWTVQQDGWLVSYRPRLVDDAGKPVPGRLLHHVAFWNTGRSDFLCPNKEEHIFGAGGEMNEWPPLPGFGYRVAFGERIRIEAMFHNPTETSYPKVYLEVRVQYQKADTGTPLQNVYPTWFDVMECKDSGYDLKAGPSQAGGVFTLPQTGRLLGVGGHMHDYGKSLLLAAVSSDEAIAVLEADTDEQGRLLSIPIVTFTQRGGLPMKKGGKLRVTAYYDNRTGKLIPDGAMGIVVGYFLPEDDTAMAVYKRKPKGHEGHE